MISVGIIHNSNSFVYDLEYKEKLEIASFCISPDRLSYHEIFDSAFSSPARYVMEIFRRLNQNKISSNGTFIFNPLLKLSPKQIDQVLAILIKEGAGSDPFVVADLQNLPLGYFFPLWIKPSEEHFLMLLTTINASLDQELINIFYFSKASVFNLRFSAIDTINNNFSHNVMLWSIYEWLARRAIYVLNNILPVQTSCIYPATKYNINIFQKQYLRDCLKFVAIMPYHAGDVLFYSIAAKHTPSHISSIVVNHRYSKIVNEVLPGYVTTDIDLIPPHRDGTGDLESEEDHFLKIVPLLSPFNVYFYLRPSRDYNCTNLHLIDHFAFALGQSYQTSADLVTKIKGIPCVYTLASTRPIKILLHFDAGWETKVYPQNYQHKLIAGLLQSGFEITVLGTEERDFGHYRSVIFKNMEQLKDLLCNHHLLVGSDSFPCHYATHVLGLPTICLFGPTKPANSDAMTSPYYKALINGLSCCPCRCLKECPINGQNSCNNFVNPKQLQEEIVSMLSAIYGNKCFMERY